MTAPSLSRWGSRAADLYGDAYAQKYRTADDAIRDGELVTRFGGWLGSMCDRFGREIDILDLGCGTGRYFHALRRVRSLTGIDVSSAMIERARDPIGRPGVPAELVVGDFLTHEFAPARFDLVYSIGVLAEHSPFDAPLASHVWQWLRPGGSFVFTVVHPRSFSIPRTLRRRIAQRLLPVTRGSIRARLRERLMRDGLYADEQRVGDVLGRAGFIVESVEPYESDIHLHLMVHGRKPA